MFSKMNLLILTTLAVLLSNNLSLAQDQPILGSQISNTNILETLVKECFASQTKNQELTYDGTNIIEFLNSEAGANLFAQSKNGLRVNSRVFSNLLGECLKSNIQKLTSNYQVQKDVTRTLTERQRDLSIVVDSLLYDQEIPLYEVESLINSGSTLRAKRDTDSPLNFIQQILLNLVIKPVRTGLNSILTFVTTELESRIIDTENITNALESFLAEATNSALKSALYIVSEVQTNINEFLDSFNSTSTNSSNSTDGLKSIRTESNALELSKSRDLIFPFNLFGGLIDTIVSPIRTTINTILVTLNTTVYSFYNSDSTNNPVQNLLNEVINGGVLNVVSVINNIYTSVNTILDSISGTSTTNSTDSSKSIRTESNILELSKNRDLIFPFNLFGGLIDTIVSPIRTTINTVLVTLNTTVYSFYSSNSTDNPVQSVLNEVINGGVLNVVSVINNIYTAVNTILDSITGTNSTTTS